MERMWMWLMAAVLAGATGASAQRPGGNVVIVARVREQAVQATISLVGTLEPKRRSVLSSEVAGLVRELPIDFGDFVKTGELVCQLRDEVFKLDLAEAQSKGDGLRAQLAELEAGTRPEALRLAKATVDEAKAVDEKWRNEKERIDTLRAGGTASSKEYRDITADFLAASKRLMQATALYELARAGPRKEVIARARHDVSAQDAATGRLADKLEKTTIRAPFSGYVISKRTEVGQWIDEGGAVAEVLDLDEVRVRVHVPESAISYLRLGDEAPVRLPGLRRRLTGTVRHIVPQADPTARTFPVEIMIDNPKHELMSGMFAWVTVRAGAAAVRLIVPTDAVVYEGRDERIFVIRERGGQVRAEPLSVRTGLPVAGGGVAVEATGLKVGDRVVTRGNERLPGASVVQILREEEPAPANAESGIRNSE